MDISQWLSTQTPASIAVIGDVCLDLYYFVNTEGGEISVETGLQTYSVIGGKQELGGGGNVAVNCKQLGTHKVDLYGIVGNDPYANIIGALLDKEKLGKEGIITQEEEWSTHVYHKIYEGMKELPRYDMGNFNKASNKSIDKIIEKLEQYIHLYDVIIINEQVPSGMHTPYMQQSLSSLIEKTKDLVTWFSDCRKLNDIYGSTIHKLNSDEGTAIAAQHNYTVKGKGEEYFKNLTHYLYTHWNQPVILTLGENGAYVCDNGTPMYHKGLYFTKEIDIVGAGDAYLAGLVVAHTQGASIQEGAMVGTYSAGVALTKLYETGHPTTQEVLSLAKDCDYRYHPFLARDSRQATSFKETDIEIITPKTVSRNRKYPQIAIFDHDGTISTLREGWEVVMKEIMLSSILGEKLHNATQAEFEKVEIAVLGMIEKTTGIQTIIQMYHLQDMVKQFGYVPKTHILTPIEYKKIYNTKLLAHIQRKRDLLKMGKLSVQDVTIKGAVAFLTTLKEKGTTLYLASGTDIEDVMKEATLLGYADLFEGRIRGSLGDVKNDPKRLVLQSIIKEVEDTIETKDIVVFGDGPVEMREAKRHNCLAIGVQSNETQRYGKDAHKRERLILAGADILIPDFSWSQELAEVCLWQ